MSREPTREQIPAELRNQALNGNFGVKVRAQLTLEWRAADLIEAFAAELAEANRIIDDMAFANAILGSIRALKSQPRAPVTPQAAKGLKP